VILHDFYLRTVSFWYKLQNAVKTDPEGVA